LALPIVHHPHYVAPLRPDHRFPMSKYGYLRDALIARGLIQAGGYVSPDLISAGALARVHDAGYVDRVFTLSLSDEEQRRIGLPRSERVVRRARLATAGTLLAARLALTHGIACNGAGGSHHAGPEGGAGFCTFNDVAVAIRALLDEGAIRRALVIDADVHQGDGTAKIFADEPAVFTLSIHAEKNYPVRKPASDLDVALPDGVEDAAYLSAFRAALRQAFRAGPFDIAFYNAGVDPHRDDRLGRLALSDEGLRERDRTALSACTARRLPVVGVIGGGYGDDKVAVAERHAILFEEAARLAG